MLSAFLAGERRPFRHTRRPVLESAEEAFRIEERQGLERASEYGGAESVGVDRDLVHADRFGRESQRIRSAQIIGPELQDVRFARARGYDPVRHAVGAGKTPGQFRSLGKLHLRHLSSRDVIPFRIRDFQLSQIGSLGRTVGSEFAIGTGRDCDLIDGFPVPPRNLKVGSGAGSVAEARMAGRGDIAMPERIRRICVGFRVVIRINDEIAEPVQGQGLTHPHQSGLPGILVSAGERIGGGIGKGPEEGFVALPHELQKRDILPFKLVRADRSEIQHGGGRDGTGAGIAPDRFFPFRVGEDDLQPVRERLGRH